ncbi:toll/interleukin-1 receptor domain-containing protein, partial [Actinomadura sp. BRA 177]|uniref:toll/interleukin-1 receptor domain-containing protein n=1 Tax=Actinomadura sp. BRA 177 TaxID=2745202 RepID=UPI0020CF1CF0
MTTPGGHLRQERPTDFFVSYSPADERWASWIAWQLEAAGHRTMIQAWDFVPGTNFIDFMDRGLSEAKAVVAVLSRNYLRSRYGRLEWMAALRADPDDPARKLVTVRIEDCPIDGLLSTITYVDLVGIDDPDEARGLLMRRIQEALAGHARPLDGPGFPGGALPEGVLPGRLEGSEGRQEPVGERPVRRAPVAAPAFPAAGGGHEAREQLSVLHISGPRFGRTLAEPGEPTTATELQDRIWSDVTRLADSGVPRPDLLAGSVSRRWSTRPSPASRAPCATRKRWRCCSAATSTCSSRGRSRSSAPSRCSATGASRPSPRSGRGATRPSCCAGTAWSAGSPRTPSGAARSASNGRGPASGERSRRRAPR